MGVRVVRVLMCAAPILAVVPSAHAAFADGSTEVQSEAEALEQDLELIAKSKGWSVTEAREYLRASDEVGRVATEVASIRPESFVGSALPLTPGGSPKLYVKGIADEQVLDLVESSGVPIEIVDQQPFSAQELEERAIRAHDTLRHLGFRPISTSVDVTGAGRIPAEVTVSPDSGLTQGDVLELMPSDLREDVVLSLRTEPVARFEAAWGGMRLRADGDNECTSGWSVINLTSGTSGILTAGHCDEVNEIDHPGSAIHNTTYVSQHQGLYGDVEWHTTTQLEPARFYATASDIRTVTGVEPRANISVNEPVAFMGVRLMSVLVHS